ncbi:MAG: SDR family oxidoreductase [Candidatus Dactylopiibacterium sp.]|nr:SDR family oxidoreductase [Candidatus Dactylopiibacterium sp.]
MNRKIALITGASRGLGRHAALTLAARGTDLILTYRQQAAEADAVVAEATALGARAVALQLDTGDTAGFAAFAAGVTHALRTHWGRDRFDYLVNNAGTGLDASFEETTEAQFDAMLNQHLKGVFFLTQGLLPLIADGGRILNVSSGLARFSYPGKAAYAVMKGGVEVLTRYLARELGPRRIAVNVIAPGAIATDFGGGTVRDNPQVNAAIAGQTALGRVGLPDDIGHAMAMLLSDDAGWINGQRIEVSGGIHL